MDKHKNKRILVALKFFFTPIFFRQGLWICIVLFGVMPNMYINPPAENLKVKVEDWLDGTKRIVIENEYLSVEILPAFGGRIGGIIYKPHNSQILYQKEIKELPDIENIAAIVLNAKGKMLLRDYDHWVFTAGQLHFDEESRIVQNYLSMRGWLECFICRNLGPNHGNEQHCARWQYKIMKDENKVEVELTYETRLDPAPLMIIKQVKLSKQSTFIEVAYQVKNLSEDYISFEYFSHCNFTPGGEVGEEDAYIIPYEEDDGLLNTEPVYVKRGMTDCLQYQPQRQWVAYIDHNKKELIVHDFSFDFSKFWIWEGNDHYSLEPDLFLKLASNESVCWKSRIGVFSGFCGLDEVSTDSILDVQLNLTNNENPEIILKIASFHKLERAEVLIKILDKSKNVLYETRQLFTNVEPGKYQEKRVKYNFSDLTGNEYILETQLNKCKPIFKKIILGKQQERKIDKKVLYVGRGKAQFYWALIKQLGVEVLWVKNSMRFLPELMDKDKYEIIIFDNLRLTDLTDIQCKAIIKYVEKGGKIIFAPISSLDIGVSPQFIPLERGYKKLVAILPIESEYSPIYVNHFCRDFFKITSQDISSSLIKDLHWESLNINSYLKVKAKKKADVLLRYNTGDPGLVVGGYGKGKVFILTIFYDSLFRGWYHRGEEFLELWRRILSLT